jgi:DNA replicative helicase MCM subunit Mcm2 (Cdc46/Mcm family)
MDMNKVMEEERARLTAKLSDIAQRRVALDQEEASVNVDLAALTAYFDTKMGKVMTRAGKTVKARGPRKAGIRDQVLSTITVEGVSKQDILTKMGATDDKSMQQAISNALVALKKDNKVISGERGQYKLASSTPVDKTPKRIPKES